MKTEKEFLKKENITERLLNGESHISLRKFLGKDEGDSEEGPWVVIKKDVMLTKEDLVGFLITPEGHIYERSEILQSLDFAAKDPNTRTPLKENQLLPLNENNIDFEKLNIGAQALLDKEESKIPAPKQVAKYLMTGICTLSRKKFLGFSQEVIVRYKEGQEINKEDLKKLVMTPEGLIYSQESLIEHLKTSNTEPLTNVLLTKEKLIPLDEKTVDFSELNLLIKLDLKKEIVKANIAAVREYEKVVNNWMASLKTAGGDYSKSMEKYLDEALKILQTFKDDFRAEKEVGREELKDKFLELEKGYILLMIEKEKKEKIYKKNMDAIEGKKKIVEKWKINMEGVTPEYRAPLIEHLKGVEKILDNYSKEPLVLTERASKDLEDVFVDLSSAHESIFQTQKKKIEEAKIKKQTEEKKKRPAWDVFNVTSLLNRGDKTVQQGNEEKFHQIELSPVKVIVVGTSPEFKKPVIDALQSRNLGEERMDVSFFSLSVGKLLRKVHVWDTSSQERYRSMNIAQYRDAKVVIAVLGDEYDEGRLFNEIVQNFNFGNKVIVVVDRNDRSLPSQDTIKRKLSPLDVMIVDKSEVDAMKEKLGEVVDDLTSQRRDGNIDNLSFR